MSLTQFIKEPDVKAKLREIFPLARQQFKQALLVEPLTNHYSLVGTAFDYLLRFALQRLHPHAIAKEWIAEAATAGLWEVVTDERGQTFGFDTLGINRIASRYGEERAWQAKVIVEDAKQHHAHYLQSGILTEDLLRSILLLAQIDPIFRSRMLYEPFGAVDHGDIEDLRQLFAIIPFEQFSSSSVCLLDPTFGVSSLVGGADVDLVIDGAIIDIKTTKFFQLNREYIDQLLGYYALYRLGGITGMPSQHVIHTLGIYFSRHGYLYTFPVSQLAREATFVDFLSWFEQRAKQYIVSRNPLKRVSGDPPQETPNAGATLALKNIPHPPSSSTLQPGVRFHPGDHVVHPIFGTGAVLKSEMEGQTEFVDVLFQGEHRKKRLSLDYARLELVNDSSSSSSDT